MAQSEEIPALLARAVAGDQQAWREIVQRWSPRVYGFLRGYTNNSDLAEEITQSVFCTVAAKLCDYVEQGYFEAWLFRVALNRLRDEMRRRKRHAPPMDAELLGDLAPLKQSEQHASGEELLALREALGQLPENDRLVIELRHQGGMGFQQMADLLHEPLGTLLARHHRALRKLKGLIGRRLGDEAE